MVNALGEQDNQEPKVEFACNLECTDEIRTLIGDEVFLLSSPITRYNKYGWRNSRILVLTQ